MSNVQGKCVICKRTFIRSRSGEMSDDVCSPDCQRVRDDRKRMIEASKPTQVRREDPRPRHRDWLVRWKDVHSAIDDSVGDPYDRARMRNALNDLPRWHRICACGAKRPVDGPCPDCGAARP